MTTPPALLIAGHGTRDESGTEALRTLVRVLGERRPGIPVAGGFFGTAQGPLPLDEAVDGLVARGVTRLAVIPLLLAPTGPVPEALPAVLERAAQRHPGLAQACDAPLGPHPKLLDVLERRLDEALGGGARRPEDRARTTVLLVGRGTADAQANAEVVRAARLLWEGRGFAAVETAFLSRTGPDVPAGLDRCRPPARVPAAAGTGSGGRIVVLPYFFFPGALLERLRMQTEGWAEAHPGTEVLGAGVLGTPTELTEVIMERYHATVAGDPLLSDATCGCRTAAPDAPETGGRPAAPPAPGTGER
ncbi:sirohydrochlorin chelatase [Streptomyces sp. NPDC055299]